MKLIWWILLMLFSGVLIHALILKIIISYLIRYTEIDAIDYLRHMEDEDASGLDFLIFKKLTEKNLLLNYRALPLIRRLAAAGFISETVREGSLNIIQSAIDQAAIAGVGADNIHICLLDLRLKPFWGTLEMARAYEDWRKFFKEQRCLTRAFWFYSFFKDVNYLKTSRMV